MIRINLLAVEKPVARTRSFSLNLGDKAGPIGAVLVLVAAVSYAGWDYFSMMQRDSQLRAMRAPEPADSTASARARSVVLS